MIAHAISKRIRGKRKLGIDPFSKEVPPIIEDTTKHIESVGLNEQGIFRIQGNSKEVAVLLQAYAKGKRLDLSRTLNVHTVASVLKQFLQNLPEPILTTELLECFLLAVDVNKVEGAKDQREAEKATIRAVRACVMSLPEGNRAVLDRVFRVLHFVSLRPANQMNTADLAQCLYPCLFQVSSSKENVAKESSEYKKAHQLLEQLIKNYTAVFAAQEPAMLAPAAAAGAGPSGSNPLLAKSPIQRVKGFEEKLKRSSIRLNTKILNQQIQEARMKDDENEDFSSSDDETQDDEDSDSEDLSDSSSSDSDEPSKSTQKDSKLGAILEKVLPSKYYMVVKKCDSSSLVLSTSLKRDWLFTGIIIMLCILPIFLSFSLWHLVLTLVALGLVYLHLPVAESLVIDLKNGKITLEKAVPGRPKDIKVHELKSLGIAEVEKCPKKKGYFRVVLKFSSGMAMPITQDFYGLPKSRLQFVADKILDYAFAEEGDKELFDTLRQNE